MSSNQARQGDARMGQRDSQQQPGAPDGTAAPHHQSASSARPRSPWPQAAEPRPHEPSSEPESRSDMSAYAEAAIQHWRANAGMDQGRIDSLEGGAPASRFKDVAARWLRHQHALSTGMSDIHVPPDHGETSSSPRANHFSSPTTSPTAANLPALTYKSGDHSPRQSLNALQLFEALGPPVATQTESRQHREQASPLGSKGLFATPQARLPALNHTHELDGATALSGKAESHGAQATQSDRPCPERILHLRTAARSGNSHSGTEMSPVVTTTLPPKPATTPLDLSASLLAHNRKSGKVRAASRATFDLNASMHAPHFDDADTGASESSPVDGQEKLRSEHESLSSRTPGGHPSASLQPLRNPTFSQAQDIHGLGLTTGAEVGPDGAPREFRAGDWVCMSPNCSFHNFSRNLACFGCGSAKPLSTGSSPPRREQRARVEGQAQSQQPSPATHTPLSATAPRFATPPSMQNFEMGSGGFKQSTPSFARTPDLELFARPEAHGAPPNSASIAAAEEWRKALLAGGHGFPLLPSIQSHSSLHGSYSTPNTPGHLTPHYFGPDTLAPRTGHGLVEANTPIEAHFNVLQPGLGSYAGIYHPGHSQSGEQRPNRDKRGVAPAQRPSTSSSSLLNSPSTTMAAAAQLATLGVGIGPGVNPYTAAEDSGRSGNNRTQTLPPVISTGNVGPMTVQPGDWVCSTCAFVNWRRRKVCMRCFPFAEGNEVSVSLASGALVAAQLAAGLQPSAETLASLAQPRKNSENRRQTDAVAAPQTTALPQHFGSTPSLPSLHRTAPAPPQPLRHHSISNTASGIDARLQRLDFNNLRGDLSLTLPEHLRDHRSSADSPGHGHQHLTMSSKDKPIPNPTRSQPDGINMPPRSPWDPQPAEGSHQRRREASDSSGGIDLLSRAGTPVDRSDRSRLQPIGTGRRGGDGANNEQVLTPSPSLPHPFPPLRPRLDLGHASFLFSGHPRDPAA